MHSCIRLSYLLGLTLLLTIGTTAQLYLMAVPVLTAILIGLRPAIAALALTSLTLFVVGVVVDARLAIPGLESMPLVEWAVISLNFAFVSSIITISCAVLLRRLERSIARSSRLVRR